MFLPSRDASTIDLVANTLGATIGAVSGALLARSPRARAAILAFRDHWFLRGKFGDIGIALLMIWLVVQLNPGIPLFATSFDPDLQLDPPPAQQARLAQRVPAVAIAQERGLPVQVESLADGRVCQQANRALLVDVQGAGGGRRLQGHRLLLNDAQ